MKKLSLLASLIFAGMLSAQTPSYVPSTNLVAWWGFTGNANDSSGNANNLTVIGATLVADRAGNANSAYSFNGTTNYLTKSSLTYNFSLAGAYSVSFWMKKNGASEGVALMSGSNVQGNFIWLLQCDTTKTVFGTNEQGQSWTFLNGTNYSTTAWEHFVLVYNNKVMQMYKNGSLVGTLTNTYTTATSAALPFYIGSAIGGGGNINANIDDVGIWSRTLTTTEISQLYSAALGTAETKSTQSAVNISPNPAKDFIMVNFVAKTNGNYSIVDVNGRTVQNGILSADKKVNVASLNKGMYFIQIQGLQSQKFLKD
ncbi:hypothetical protein ASG01_12515 [Chryseobacterium sp. Leaf180]|uniref:LamG-like jellyroll fold domain-containing protein n=1 Tax=Chryseobacterium sp. Leaf180 TaxID=1736289 RepID=UPI00070076E5|nr:LamG-like jellyroll fold domain-containing protein [Chryseobacterium sp. Leaf180]KQR92706.1 hypothetical protein ASG01_12515 [Chryseobacterium sp. Leaf180]